MLCSSLHTRNKQQKLAKEKLLHKPWPFGLSVSCNLKLKQGCAHARTTYDKVIRVCKQFQFLGPDELSTALWQPCTKVVYKAVTSMNNLGISIRDTGCSCTSQAIEWNLKNKSILTKSFNLHVCSSFSSFEANFWESNMSDTTLKIGQLQCIHKT